MEYWRDIRDYEEYYQVSNLGRIRSLPRLVRIQKTQGFRKVSGRIRRLSSDRYGHLMVDLWKDGQRIMVAVHKIVASAFLGPCPQGQQIRHGPNGKLDNSVSNLCYGTRSEDGLDKRRDGTHSGRPVRRSDGIEYISMAVAAEEMGCSPSSIWGACNGTQKTSGGFSWTYI